MKKKGFTLIELLAVIIILGVIALITTPIVMNSINDARRKSMENSALGIIRAIDVRRMRKDVAKRNIDYKINVGIDSTAIEYSGQLPDEGWAHIDEDGYITLYMKNDNYCVYRDKAVAGNDDIVITDHPEDCNQKIGEIRDNTAYAEIKENTIIDGEEPTPTPGYSYEPKTGDETYAGILYLDPTDLSATCNAELAAANKQGQDINGNATLTGTKTGCMKWFAFGDDGNGNPTTAILDHNTTAKVAYDFENKNSEANGRVQDDYEADWQLAQDTSNWDSSLSARFPTATEIANAGGITETSGGSFGGGNSASQNGKYWWLYTNLNGVASYNGQGNDNASYQYYSNASGSTSSGSIFGYWTSTPHAGSTIGVWFVSNFGSMIDSSIYATPRYGVRPVISLSSLSLTN